VQQCPKVRALVRLVVVYVGDRVLLQLLLGAVDSCHSVEQFASRSRES
jgi:hypothetical protein